MARWFAANEASAPAGVLRNLDSAPGARLELLLGEPGVALGPFAVRVPGAAPLAVVGEVTLHNRGELVRRLSSAGVDVPPVRSDVEVLALSYARFGLAGVVPAEGMFAMAVADGSDLVLLRDHVGSRTAFYAWAGDGWTASTSLRALRRRLGARTGLNLAAVRSFLTFAYLPGDETLLRGVHELLPGRCVRLRQDGTRVVETFWEPAEAVDDTVADELHVARLRELLDTAVACRLPAAEPVGVLLSGGVDSSLVTALAAKLHDAPVRTYSISFGDELPNERAYSGLVAAHCHTDHRVLTVSGRTIADRLADTVAMLDSPVGDPLTVPNLLLAEAVAADGATVALNGEGGDPVFGGPKNLPMLVDAFHSGLDSYSNFSSTEAVLSARATTYLRAYRKCFIDLPVLLTPQALAALDALGAEAAPERFVTPYLAPGRMRSLLNELLHCNLRTKGAHHILTKVERITASQGLEGRAPLFDRSVVDHAFAVPPRLKLAGGVEKWILKRAVADLLPATVVDRPKSGMRVPVQQWLRGPLRELSGELLLGESARARGLFRPDTVSTWLRGDGLVLPRQGGKLWLLLTLELWLRAFELDGPGT